ncbi:NAD-dependent epimerase [Echinicola salinicaeni]|uniref:NAD-dependent epimerase n=1 Tax=Echinicola salinicaeni TaxID=2762757 RepID=UPI0016442122|nr:NAD-dependent epimerase [Echinicola salinicaeni]
MKVLITGMAGFIGFHLAKRLIGENHIIVGLDNINDYYDTNLKFGRLKELGFVESNIGYGKKVESSFRNNISFIQGSLEDKKCVDELFEIEQFDVVVNLAAQAGVRYSIENPLAYIDSNILGFTHILEACRYHDIKHLVYASSSSVYGANSKVPFSTSDTVDNPVSLYAATKKSNELMAHTYSHLYDIPTTGLRFFTVYGPWGRPDMALFLFTKAIIDGKPIKVFNNGDMMRDFTYIDDIIEGILRVINNPPKKKKSVEEMNPSTPPYKVYNIGNSKPVKLMDFVEAIENSLGVSAEKDFLPMQPGDVPSTYADTSDLEKELGYKPNTALEIGVKKFVDWYQSFYAVSAE